MARAARSPWRTAAAGGLLMAIAEAAPAQQPLPTLVADPRLSGPAPIPVAERDVPTATARRWLQVIAGDTPLEGVADGADGAVLVCDVDGGRVLRIDGRGSITTLLDRPALSPGGLAVRADGSILVAGAGDMRAGSIGLLSPDRGFVEIVPRTAGYVPNDLVAAPDGGFYFTDFKGSAFEATGGVYHVAADLRTITPIVTGMALPNGIALSPDGKTLWIAEHGRNRLVRIKLDRATRIAPLGIDVAYNFIGPKPDTVRTDARGNVYVALNGQGRVLVLSPGGIPIGQILMPGRNDGSNLRVTSLAIRPDSGVVHIVASDDTRGGQVFRARTFSTVAR